MLCPEKWEKLHVWSVIVWTLHDRGTAVGYDCHEVASSGMDDLMTPLTCVWTLSAVDLGAWEIKAMAEPLPWGCRSVGLSTIAVRMSTFGLAPPLLLTTTAHLAFYSLLLMLLFQAKLVLKETVNQKGKRSLFANLNCMITTFDNIYFQLFTTVCVCLPHKKITAYEHSGLEQQHWKTIDLETILTLKLIQFT